MSERVYSQELVDAIGSFLTNDEWRFDCENGIFRFNLGVSNKIKSIKYTVFVNENDYTVYANFPLGVEKDNKISMLTMAEFICRANSGLKNGNFELDMNDGEICYKSHVNCTDMMLSEAVIRSSIYVPGLMVKRYSDGILAILFGNANAKDAVEECERKE